MIEVFERSVPLTLKLYILCSLGLSDIIVVLAFSGYLSERMFQSADTL